MIHTTKPLDAHEQIASQACIEIVAIKTYCHIQDVQRKLTLGCPVLNYKLHYQHKTHQVSRALMNIKKRAKRKETLISFSKEH